MDKIINLFSTRLELMCEEYKMKIYSMPSWQLDGILPNEIKQKNNEEKVSYVVKKFAGNHPFYKLLKGDMELVERKREDITFDELKSAHVDPRYLEGKGLSQSQIMEFYEFVAKLKTFF
ncbi:MAG: hypothetical protein ABJB11_17410 [Ferruginibacter sp.]